MKPSRLSVFASLSCLLFLSLAKLPIASVSAADSPAIAQSDSTKTSDLFARMDTIAREITIRIDSQQSGNGSGVLIAREGKTYYVLTAAHVVAKSDRYQIVTPDKQTHAVNNSATTVLEGVDLAVVTFESDREYQLATLADYDTDKAPWIAVSGFPGAKTEVSQPKERILTGGKILREDLTDFLVKDPFSLSNGYGLVYTNMSYPGMSGGAVLDVQGRVIGINTAAENEIEVNREGQAIEISMGFSLGIPIRTFTSLLNKTKIPPQSVKVETSIPPAMSETQLAAFRQDILARQIPPQNATEFDWLNWGNQLWRSARFDEAVAAFDRAIQLKPDFYQAYYAKGYALMSARKYAEATAAFEKTTQLAPQFSQAWRFLGNTLFFLKRYQEALEAIDRAIASKPDEFVLYIERAEALRGLRRYEEAIASCNKGLSIKTHPWGYNNRGLAYMEMLDFPKALADLNKAIELQPDYGEAYSNRGLVYTRLKDFPKALADLNQSLALTPDLIEAKTNRGLTYYYMRDYEKALIDLNEAIAIAPNLPHSYMNRGLVYTDTGDYQKAMSDLNKAITLDPTLADAYLNRGRTYYFLKDYQKAIADYNKTLELQPNYAQAYSNRGLVYVDLRDFQKALGDLNRAIAIDPNLAEAYTNRGLAYYLMQDYPGALTDFDRAIALDPNLPQAYTNRGLIHAINQDYQKALNDLNKAIELQPNLTQAYGNRGLTYYLSKDYQKAIADYNQAIAIQPDYAQAYFGRGLAYADLRDYQKAREDLQKAAQLFQQQGQMELYQTAQEFLDKLPKQ